MRISRELYGQMVAHAQADAPLECCGLLACDDGDVVAVHPAVNIAESKLRFEIDPLEVLRLTDAIDARGLDLGAIYHSHTRSDPYPSQTDINFARSWPGVVWIIVGTAQDQPLVRSFDIRDGKVSEVDLDVQ